MAGDTEKMLCIVMHLGYCQFRMWDFQVFQVSHGQTTLQVIIQTCNTLDSTP